MSELKIAEFLGEIRWLHYVVQRNWEKLPGGFVEGHADLDLFVSERDREKLLSIVAKYPEIPIDVRYPDDGYYPLEIGLAMLTDRVAGDLFWRPNNKAHFLSLYYHNLIHKENDPYGKELKEIFKKAYPPVKCEDEGVGFHV